MNESISVIIISYNCMEDVIECIKSIIMTCFENIPEIIVVDNNSSDDTVETIKLQFPDVKIVQNELNKGYAFAINQGVIASSGEYLILSNADVIYLNNTIYDLVKEIEVNSEIGLVSPQQIFKNGNYQRSYGHFPSLKRGLLDLFLISFIIQVYNKYSFKNGIIKSKQVEYLDGAILCTSRTIFDELNGFDDDFFFYSEEVDFCYRLETKGYKRVLLRKCKAIHHRGGSQENSGMNKDSIVKLVNSEIQFILKHQNKSAAKLYLNLEYLFFKLLHFINTLRNNEVKKSNNLFYLKAIKEVMNELKL